MHPEAARILGVISRAAQSPPPRRYKAPRSPTWHARQAVPSARPRPSRARHRAVDRRRPSSPEV
eukprot:scaffold217424_cov31-Tisochrysis_lutea.AAC.2